MLNKKSKAIRITQLLTLPALFPFVFLCFAEDKPTITSFIFAGMLGGYISGALYGFLLGKYGNDLV